MNMDDSNTKYELQITKDNIYSTDGNFTITDLSLGDTYEFFDAYFVSSNGEIIRRIQKNLKEKNLIKCYLAYLVKYMKSNYSNCQKKRGKNFQFANIIQLVI